MLMERTETMSSLSALASPQSCRRKLFSPESMPSPPSTASSDLTNTTDKSLKDGKGERVSRAKNLTEEEKSKIAAMQKPSDMDYKERKRQYAALRRAIVKEAAPELVAKFSLATDKERFGMLKAWCQNQDLGSIEVEEKYKTWVQNLRTDRYVTVTILQLEKMFGKSSESKDFIAELIKGQVGVPHPQAPNVKKAKMYKVLKEVIEDTSVGSQSTNTVSLAGRVKDASAKQLLAKQLGGLNGEVSLMNQTTGTIKSKKPKKEKSPEEESLADMKKLSKKWKTLFENLETCINELSSVRNSSELVAALKSWHPTAEDAIERVVALAGKPVSEINLADFSDQLTNEKKIAAQIETDVKDAKRRINAAKGPTAKRKAQKPATNNSEDDADADADESE
ncbi:unnamed protein product [Cladocopium goreaui]|uniref:Uncharacterized protein n=1 Tax=Cladocopium goreaui TaxID=2562237 RepID=A0A9P1CBR6_9DINO|nr:unnamed protein product [Cladocopium goreaui]